MKILDKYLLKSFLITFTTVFVILFFIFVLQVVWLFIAELAGKDLDILMIVKFLLFKMPSIIPLVLPLSVLLASIMTFGSLAENYEFAAIKSSGISLQRAMRSLTVFIAILSVVAFLFANNVIPFAEYKFINFRRNIAQVKPAMAIAEGQFSEIGNYNIKVEKKSGEKGEHLDGITIHQKSTIGSGANTVIKAKKGELVSSTNSNVLKLILKDGNYYEDITPKKFEDRNKVPFAKSEFKSYVINIDLSKLNNANIDEQKITNTNTMLTVGELKYTLDSLQTDYNKNLVSQNLNLNQRFVVGNSFANGISTNTNTLSRSNILENFSGFDKQQILRAALGSIDATSYSLDSSSFEMIEKKKNINSHWIALYDKFVIAYACLLMFFIGAPLGAIIRKGGLGLPIVFAILIFITFHFINTFGKKVAQQDGMTPFLGCWLSSFVLTPLAITLTKIATDDKGVSFNFSLGRLQPILNRFFNTNIEDEGIPEQKTIIAEKTIIEKTPEKEEKETSAILNIDYSEIAEVHHKHTLFSSIALACYFLLMGITFFVTQLESIFITIGCVSSAPIFIFSVLTAQKQLNTICGKLGLKTDLPIIVIVLAGYPFYLLFYLYNRFFLKGLLNRFNKI